MNKMIAIAFFLTITPAYAQSATAPLFVETVPTDARVTIILPDQVLGCQTPCTAYIPAGAPFRLRIEKPGYESGPLPEVRWRTHWLRTGSLEPSSLLIHLSPTPPKLPASTDTHPAPLSP